MLNEGFFKNLATKLKTKSLEAVKLLTSKTLSGIVSLAGIGVSIFTGGLGAALVLRAIYAVEKHGKVLSNAFEKQFTRFVNSKGVILSIDFSLKNNSSEDSTRYSLRFYVKDMSWRLLNIDNQLKHPSLEYVKQVVEF